MIFLISIIISINGLVSHLTHCSQLMFKLFRTDLKISQCGCEEMNNNNVSD